MSGISSKFAIPLLNTLVCRDGAAYNKDGSSYDRVTLTGMEHRGTIASRGSSQPYDVSWYVAYDASVYNEVVLADNYTNIATPVISNCYLGLLYDKPQYYIGSGTQHPAKNVANYEQGQEIYPLKSFLDIHEIPNRSHNGLLGNSADTQQHYWPGYARVKLGSIAHNSSTSSYENNMAGMSYAELKTNYIIEGNNCYNKPRVETQNTIGMFLGENDTKYPWYPVKYFGLFRQASDTTNIHVTENERTKYYYIETTPDLYLWGELSESNNWYHEWTKSQADWASKKSSLYEYNSETDTYFLTQDTEMAPDPKKYYEKTGVIIGPDEGAAFSVGAFKLIFEDSSFSEV